MKIFLIVFVFVLSSMFLPINTCAIQVNYDSEEKISNLISYYNLYYKNGEIEKWENATQKIMFEIDGPGYKFIPECVDSLQNNENKLIKISYDIIPFGGLTVEKIIELPDYNTDFVFILFLKNKQEYESKFNLSDRLVYSLKEILNLSGIDDCADVGLICIQWNWSEGYNTITNCSVYSCAQGWNTIDNEEYYVSKNGTLATKPCVINNIFYIFDKSAICKGTYTGWAKSAGNKVYYKDGLKVTKNTTINGVRWKFDKNGICQGKYSGFLTSSKGRRYYNNGVMLRNQKFTLNGKKYAADSKGWATEI